MKNFEQAVQLAKVLVEQAATLEAKYTKSESKRIRLTLGELKKVITPARADLVEKDKG